MGHKWGHYWGISSGPARPASCFYGACGNGWGGRIRTYDTCYQKALPYHLATPQLGALISLSPHPVQPLFTEMWPLELEFFLRARLNRLCASVACHATLFKGYLSFVSDEIAANWTAASFLVSVFVAAVSMTTLKPVHAARLRSRMRVSKCQRTTRTPAQCFQTYADM